MANIAGAPAEEQIKKPKKEKPPKPEKAPKAPKTPKVKAPKKEKAPKRPKAPKKEKVPKERAPKPEKAPREQSDSSLMRASLSVLFFMLFLLAASASILYFNLFDSKQIAVNLLMEGKSPYSPQIQKLEELAAEIAQENIALEEARAELDKREKALAKSEKDVAAREASVIESNEQLDQRAELMASAETDQANLIAMYEKMSAENAATIFEEIYDNEDIAILLAGMKDAKASAILAAMTPERAARVTELLIG